VYERDKDGGGMSARSIRVGRSHPQDGSLSSSDHRAVAAAWRQKRLRQVQALAQSLAELRWSSALLQCVVGEMKIEEDFAAVLGDPTQIPIRRYPQAVAIAIALRHSWRPDLFARMSRELRRLSRIQHRSRSRDPRRSAKQFHLPRRRLRWEIVCVTGVG